MAEDEKTEQKEETPEAEAPEEKPEAEAGEEKPEGDAPEEKPEAEAAEEPAAETPPDQGDEELEGLDWKARRRLERSRRPAEPRPQQSPAERAAARSERRAQTRKVRGSYRAKRRQKGEAGTGTAPAERRSVARKLRQGTVVSDRADKTITVRIDVARRHPTYEKIVRSSNTLHAHDERNEANEGDLVRIVETRPISRSKRWRLVEVLEKAK
jgi:small subunit ribosomal protein S17